MKESTVTLVLVGDVETSLIPYESGQLEKKGQHKGPSNLVHGLRELYPSIRGLIFMDGNPPKKGTKTKATVETLGDDKPRSEKDG